MSKFNDTGFMTDTAAGALGQYIRVKTPGALAAAGATDKEIGQTTRATFAAGPVTVCLRTKPGTQIFVAANAITKGNPVYTAASGKVSASQATGALLIGTALETTTADGDFVEVLRDTFAA